MTFGLLDEEDRLLDLPETLSHLRVSRRTVERLGQEGTLTRVKVLGATRYRASEIQQIIREGTRPIRKGPRR